MKVLKWHVELFNRSVLLAYTESELEAVKSFDQFAGTRLGLDVYNGDIDGWAQSRGGDVYVWANKPSVLLHEFVHAAFALCRHIDAQPDEEIIARLVEHMKLNLMDNVEWSE